LTYQTGFSQDILAYWVVFCLQYAATYHMRYREQERRAAQLQVDEADLRAQLAGAELTRLRRQLQPRLVFDTLDTTAALIREDKHDEAEDLLAALGDLLRSALDDPHAGTVSLGREIEHVRAYLAVEQLRLNGGVHSRLLADPATLNAAVMPASIQPIVQHALELILDEREAVGSITLRSARVNDFLTVEVECFTPTPLVESLSRDLEPLLESIRARLRKVYGARFELCAIDRGEATVVTLLLPYQPVAEFLPALSLEPTLANLPQSDR
jgi:two-component system sensor histidine kinase LytS